MNIPKGHQTLMPYLMLDNASAFITFVEQVFHVKPALMKMRDEKVVMHSEVMIGDSTIMFCDATEQWKAQTANMFVYVADADDSFKRAVAAGATVVMDLADQDYGRSCGVKDTTGNVWWITSVKS
jgi:PhnB protein